VTGVGEVFIQITLRQCSPLLRQQEVETQMHADQQGYTQRGLMAATKRGTASRSPADKLVCDEQ
jgi:hypothetical protein